VKDPDNARVPIRVSVASRSQEYNVSLCSGVEAILCPTNIVRGVVDPECLVLIDASVGDLDGGSVLASEVGVRRIIWFISEARQEMVL
jgi:hypothetical protein